MELVCRPLMSEGQPVVVLQDTGCNIIIVKCSLISNTTLTGGTSTVHLLDRTCLSLPQAEVENDSRFFSGRILATCIENPLHNVIIGNIEGARDTTAPGTDLILT